MSTWIHLPEYDACPLGSLALRLWVLKEQVYDGSALLAVLHSTGMFAEELRLLFEVVPWRIFILTDWAHYIFQILAELSKEVCESSPSDICAMMAAAFSFPRIFSRTYTHNCIGIVAMKRICTST